MNQKQNCQCKCKCNKCNNLLQIAINQIIQSNNKLILKDDSFNLELDSEIGQLLFRQYMQNIGKLIKIIGVQITSRSFRMNYTNAYRVLYKQGELGYIAEIFDSAQQSFPYIWVNGDRFDFSEEVINQASRLVEAYYSMIQLIRFFHSNILQEFGHRQVYQLANKLQNFDKSWITYESKYINQLIDIEQKSRQKIQKIIKHEKQLQNYQKQQKKKGKIFLMGLQYDQLRQKLCSTIAQLNSIANIEGKGRDDLTYEILQKAQNVIGKITHSQSPSIRYIAQKIRQTFNNIRQVLKFFGQNIQMVDPQLKNNQQLVLALEQYEIYWQKGKRYFIDENKQQQILAFQVIIQAAKQKYNNFQQMLQYSDPNIFWIIPSLIILRSLQGEDEGLTASFFNHIELQQKYNEHKKLIHNYQEWKKEQKSTNNYQCYNQLEELLINGQYDSSSNNFVHKLVLKVKQLAVSLQRGNPKDWNDMLGILLNDQQ